MCGGPSLRMKLLIGTPPLIHSRKMQNRRCVRVVRHYSGSSDRSKILETSAEQNPMLTSLVRLLNLDHAFRGGALDFFDAGNNAAGKSVKRFSLDCIFSA